MKIQRVGNYQTTQNKTKNPNFGMILKIRTPKEEGARKLMKATLANFAGEVARNFLEKNPIAKTNFDKLKDILAKLAPANIEVIAERPIWFDGGNMMFSLPIKCGDYDTRQIVDLVKATPEKLEEHAQAIKRFHDVHPKLYAHK